MLTRDEVLQLILYLIVATVLLLAGRVRAETMEHESQRRPSGTNMDVPTDRQNAQKL